MIRAMRVYHGFNGVQGQPCITMTMQSTGESLMSLARASMVYNYETEESKRISGSQMPRIVPKKPVMTVEERRAHNNALPEETFTVLRDGGLDGNEIRKNSR